MKVFLILLASSLLPVTSLAQDVCQVVAGASFVASDGTFLGRATNEYDSDSVLNQYGSHGSEHSADSIWNEYGQYGGQYAAMSPFNPYSSTPPMIIKNGNVIGSLTVNRSVQNSLNPYVLKTCSF